MKKKIFFSFFVGVLELKKKKMKTEIRISKKKIFLKFFFSKFFTFLLFYFI